MTTSGVNSDRHLTLLATWLVRTLGRALLASLVVPVVLIFLGVVSRQFWLIYLGLGSGPFVFAWFLTKASAPSPAGDRLLGGAPHGMRDPDRAGRQ